jgi:dienelactone hydrolase
VDQSPFADRAAPFESRVTFASETADFRLYQVSYPSPMTTAFPANNMVYGAYYLPRSKSDRKLPAVIVLHILGGPDGPSVTLAESLARHGLAALHLVMPFYGPRADGTHRLLSFDVDLTVQSVRQAVMDIRRGVDWLATRPEVDPERIGVTGISLGGNLACLAFSVEPRFRAGVLMLAGGDLARILTASELTASRRQQMEALGLNYQTLSEKLVVVDPLTYAPGVNRRGDLLLFNARSDEVVLPECAEALWLALGKPPRYWLYAGHYTALIYLADVLDMTTSFFQRKFSS